MIRDIFLALLTIPLIILIWAFVGFLVMEMYSEYKITKRR